MQHFIVTWEIDIEADTPEAAARRAREIQLDPDSTATFFDVLDDNGELHTIELPEGGGSVSCTMTADGWYQFEPVPDARGKSKKGA